MKLVSWRCILEQLWKEKGLNEKSQERKQLSCAMQELQQRC